MYTRYVRLLVCLCVVLWGVKESTASPKAKTRISSGHSGPRVVLTIHLSARHLIQAYAYVLMYTLVWTYICMYLNARAYVDVCMYPSADRRGMCLLLLARAARRPRLRNAQVHSPAPLALHVRTAKVAAWKEGTHACLHALRTRVCLCMQNYRGPSQGLGENRSQVSVHTPPPAPPGQTLHEQTLQTYIPTENAEIEHTARPRFERNVQASSTCGHTQRYTGRFVAAVRVCTCW